MLSRALVKPSEDYQLLRNTGHKHRPHKPILQAIETGHRQLRMFQNIEYILTAEFHVDKGPSLLHQFPRELPGIQDLVFLPELMIPDQIHKRPEDFTLFLLYRNAKTGHFQYVNDRECESQPYYLYTIVNNLTNQQVKRGSIIKSLSIVTKLSYFKNFNPLLLITLDKYFDNNDFGILQQLYTSVNEKNFIITSKPVDTRQKHRPGSASASTSHDISIIKKLLITSILDLPINDKIYYDESFRNKLLEIDLNNPDLFIRKDLSYNSIINFNNMKIPIKIPMINLPDNIGDYLNPTDLNFKANLIQLLNSKLVTDYLNYDLTIYGLQTPSIILLINAILTGKKIIILSYDKSSGYIIDFILMILKTVTGGGILSGILSNYNVFPMLDVSKVDYLEQCDSYIAGTINPFFKNTENLWDLLYDLDSNEIYLSKYVDQPDIVIQNSIISEDAKFLSNLQLSLFNYNDDLTTIQLILRRHINEIIRILISSTNFEDFDSLTSSGANEKPNASKHILLLQGIGYFWASDTSKLIEISCYQAISKKFNHLVYNKTLKYNLLLPNLSNELNLMIDLQYHLQKLNNISNLSFERNIWFNILKYLISGKSLEVFLLVTYLIPPNSSSSLQSSSLHGGNLTIFDKNKGIELLLLNLFNNDNQIKSNIIMILQELNENFLCGWCLHHFLSNNLVYQMAFDDLLKNT